ncbi:hypothetical protein [Carnobacterium sp. ISL-102]|uniref:hypothetical protein n=1 Tax=Carnobacterium sp. ISL-102 TaxID=2819142 RepID=UPI001BE9702B|nr:hypothetical protein [Carnobacterium sp. ISL-102]MBT2731658.1 hypothetical protein [Carnobacterium sp. ISL-102]
MTPTEKKAFESLKFELWNYPEMVMVTVSRKELEAVINYIKKEQKKPLTSTGE